MAKLRTSSALRAASPKEKRLGSRPPKMLDIREYLQSSRFSFGEAAQRADEVPVLPYAIALHFKTAKSGANVPRSASLPERPQHR